MPLSASIGAARSAEADPAAAELLHRADLAMYGAKRAGGDRHAVYDPAVHNRAGLSGPSARAAVPRVPITGV